MGVYGMSYEQFWLDDPWKAKWYRQAYVAKRREENRRDWLLGAYVYHAMGTVLGNAFRKKGAKPEHYLEEPFPVFETAEDREARRQKEAAQTEAVLKAMIAKQRAEKLAKEQGQQDAEIRGSYTKNKADGISFDDESDKAVGRDAPTVCGGEVVPEEHG